MLVNNSKKYICLFIFVGLSVFWVPGGALAGSELSEIRDYRAAVGLLREGKLELARTQYSSFLENYPDSERRPRAFFGLAETYYLESEYDTAARYYRRALEMGLGKDYRSKAYRRGLISARDSEQLRETRKIIDLAGDSPAQVIPREGILEAVKFFERRGRRTEALELVEAVLEQEPGNPEWLHEKAVLLAGLGRLDRGRDIVDELLNKGTKFDTEARFLRAEILSRLGELASARKEYERLLSVPEFRLDSLYGLAWVEIDSENYEEALAWLTQLVNEQSGDGGELGVLAARDLARLHARLGETTLADSWYDTAINVAEQPRESELLIEKARFLVDRGRLKDAVPYFEQAELTLPVESKKNLIEGYLARREYDSAVVELEQALEAGVLEGYRWRRLLAYSQFRLHNFEAALDVIPEPREAPRPEEAVKTFRLLGSIHYRRDELDEAEAVFENWKSEYGGLAPELHLALVRDKLGRTDQAVGSLREVLAADPGPSLEARTRYHLARLMFPDDLDAVEKQLEAVETEKLKPGLRIELDLLRQAFKLKRGEDEAPRKFVREVREKIERDVYLGRWYGTLLQAGLSRSWWTDLLLPELRESRYLVREWGARSLRHMRRRGWLDLARRTGREIVPSGYSSRTARRLRLAYFEVLLEAGKLKQLEDELAGLDQLDSWSGENVRDLVRLLTKFYRRTDQTAVGYTRLREISQSLSDLSSKNRTLISESMAALALESGREDEALDLLAGISVRKRSPSGELNLAIAEYHGGRPDSAYRRLEQLRGEWDSPPHAFYDYGFRLLRSRGEVKKLKQWSREFLTDHGFQDTETVKPLVDNVRFWSNHGAGTAAVEFIDRLEQEFADTGFLARLEYYRGVAYYNLDRLSEARETFERVRKSYTPGRRLRIDVLRSEVELAVRLNDWPLAYSRWRKLHELGAGGETGGRLVNELGLRQVPDKFKQFISIMEADYPEFLAPGDTLYWQGRVADSRGRDTEAVEYYSQYLESGATDRRTETRRRLARGYEALGMNRKALEQWRRLSQVSDRTEPLVHRAIISRELGEVERSTEFFRKAREQAPSRQHWFDYQLGRNLVLSGQVEPGLSQIEASLADAPATAAWLREARLIGGELALTKKITDSARRFLKKLDSGPRVLLYRAELERQLDQLDEARKHLDEFERVAEATGGLAEDYREVGAMVYSQSDSYGELLELLPELPEKPEHQLLRLRALVELDRLETAGNFYQRLDSSLVQQGAEILADAYFEAGEWRYARGYYEEAAESPRVLYRLSEVELSLQNYPAALNRFEKTLELLASNDFSDWRKPLLDLAKRLAEAGNFPGEVAGLIEEHWQIFKPAASKAARLACRLALRADSPAQVKFYLARLPADKLTVEMFEEIAGFSTRREAWELLARLLDSYEPRRTQSPHAYDFYDHLVELRTSGQLPDGFEEKLNSLLDRAIPDESPYVPRTQELVGDLYFKRGEFEKAAVEYNKVRILFDDPPNLKRSRYKLGLCHLKMKNQERARNIFEELGGDSAVEPDLRRRVQNRLEEL